MDIVIHAPPPPDSLGKCPLDAPLAPLRAAEGGPATLRLTYRASGGPLLCDVVLPLDGPKRLVGVPPHAGPIDLLVEAFRADDTLAASGQALALDLSTGGERQVFVAPRDQFACTQRTTTQGRAFHSATTLPSGEVLLVGGLVPSATDPAVTEVTLDAEGGRFFASASVELYDPQAGTFRSLEVAGLTPRAFHHAVLLADGRVLLVGGLTADGVAVRVRTGAQAFRLVPDAAASIPPAEILTLGDTPSVTELDTSVEPRAFAALADDLLVGGYADLPGTFHPDFERLDPTDGTSLLVGALAGPGRAGATATRLSPERVLVWGGNLGSVAGNESQEAGSLIAGATSTLVGLPVSGPNPLARAFHAAVGISDDVVVVAGGFRIAGGSTGDPAGAYAERLTFDGDALTVEALSLEGTRPVGYLDGAPLLGGDALFSGGSPPVGVPGAACPDGTTSFPLCSTRDAVRFRATGGTLEPATPLVESRFGHRSVTLGDGTLLVTGGFQNRSNRLFAVRAAELFNPRSEALDLLAGSARAAGDVTRGKDGEPSFPCTVVEASEDR